MSVVWFRKNLQSVAIIFSFVEIVIASTLKFDQKIFTIQTDL